MTFRLAAFCLFAATAVLFAQTDLASASSVPVDYQLPSPTIRLRVEILNLQGCIVRVLHSNCIVGDVIAWDKKNQYGDPVAPGHYIARVVNGRSVESRIVLVRK